MKQVVNISLAGIGFTIETEAYDRLDTYLNALKKYYGTSADAEEIMNDIEARIVELILSQQETRIVVDTATIDWITAEIGLPDAEENAGETGLPSTVTAGSEPQRVFARRLYRNPDGARLGGVCNGIATYFNIDVRWVRLGFGLPILLRLTMISAFHPIWLLNSLMDVAILLYFVLWIVVPVAKTPRQKLEMKGEKVTASSIEQSIRDDSAGMPEAAQRSASVLANLFTLLGKIIIVFIKVIGIIIVFSIAMAALGILTGIFAAIFAGKELINPDILQFLSVIDGISPATLVVMALFAAFIPLALIVYSLSGAIFNYRLNKTFIWVMALGWIFINIFFGVTIIQNKEQLKESARTTFGTEVRTERRQLRNRYKDENRIFIINGDTINPDKFRVEKFIHEKDSMDNLRIEMSRNDSSRTVTFRIDNENHNSNGNN